MNVTTNCNSFFEKTEAIVAYEKGINKYPMLTLSQEQSLFEEYTKLQSEKNDILNTLNGDMLSADTTVKEYIAEREAKMAEIKSTICNSNLRFAYAVARRYANNSEELTDLLGLSYLALSTAFEKFDATRGVKFITHAVNYLRRDFDNYTKINNVVTSNSEKVNAPKIKKAKNKFFLENGRDASDEEIISIMEKDYGLQLKYNDLIEIQIDTIDFTSSDDDTEERMTYNTSIKANAAENIADDDDYFADASDTLSKLMEVLDEREYKIITMALGYTTGGREMKNEEIAQTLGNIGTERVRQIRNAAVKKMQKFATSMVF